MKEKNFLTLTEDDGTERTYELIDECEINGSTYVAVSPAEYYVLKRVKSDKKEDVFETVEGKELSMVSEVFDSRLNIESCDNQ